MAQHTEYTLMWPFTKKSAAGEIEPKLHDAGQFPSGYTVNPRRPDVFDPALRHYGRAFIKGEPIDLSPEALHAFRGAHQIALQTALAAIVRANLSEQLVLRGSVTLAHWFPDRARSAKDLDFVVVPHTMTPASGKALMRDVCEVVTAGLLAAGVNVCGQAKVDAIWTYERAEGRRITVPWKWEDNNVELQIDLVFQEPLHTPSVRTDMVVADQSLSLYFASQAESLAWKLLWLQEDSYPQQKDLYDAVLLAEATPLPLDLFRRVLESKGVAWNEDFTDPTFVRGWTIDSTAGESPHDTQQCQEALVSLLRLI